MDDDILIERINRIYDDLWEHGLMEDMSREEHESMMLAIAHDFRELGSRERIFVVNPPRYKLAVWIYRQICHLMDNCEEKYEIYIQKHLTFTTSISIIVLIESLDVSMKNIAILNSIMPCIDGFSLWPGDNDRVRISFEIHDVYIESGGDGEPSLNHVDE